MDDVPTDLGLDRWGNANKAKYFWVFPVYNHDEKTVQIMEVTQKSIRETIKSLINNPKWGKPFAYDLTITRTGEGLETQYQVTPNPKEELPTEVQSLIKKTKINLEAWMRSEDPFSIDKFSAEALEQVFNNS